MSDNNVKNSKEEDSGPVAFEDGNEEVGYEEDGEKIVAKIGDLRKKLAECREEKEKNLAGWQRAQADFINYRRREEEQRVEWACIYSEAMARDILPVLDSFDAALRANPEDEGLKTLNNQLKAILKKHGLEEIKVSGEKLDPKLHEAIEFEEGNNANSVAVVAEEVQKGYLLNGKLLRAAKVKVKK